MSEEEDLEVLRSAALASIGKKRSSKQNENDDLYALRKKALTSRKRHNDTEDVMFEKLKPVRSSNLINLTPVPAADSNDDAHSNHSTPSSVASENSADEQDLNKEEVQKALSSDDSDSESEQSDVEESSSSEAPQATENKINCEEDDLLNAIDQFLDEGVVMLEQVTEAASNKPKKEKKKNKVKEKVKTEKKSKKRKSKSEISSNEKAVIKKSVDNTTAKPIPTEKRNDIGKQHKFSPAERPKNDDKKNTATRTPRRPPAVWTSDDIPLNKQIKQNGGSDSVHSSDLSFLSNSDNEDKVVQKNNDETTEQIDKGHSPKAGGRYIRINKRRLSELQRENMRQSEEQFVPIARRGQDSLLPDRASRREANLPDLREKLKQRGYPQKKEKDSIPDESQNENAVNNGTSIGKKIYVKPSVVRGAREESKRNSAQSRKANLPGSKQERLIVTRDVSEGSYLPLKVKVADKDEPRVLKRFGRKRSVVEFKPEETIAEKQKRLDTIKKEVEETIASDRFSDLSENFDDFEIGEPDSLVEKKVSEKPRSLKAEDRVDRRTFLSTLAKSDDSLSDYDEGIDEQEKSLQKTSANESDSDDAAPVRVRSAVKRSIDNLNISRSRKRSQDWKHQSNLIRRVTDESRVNAKERRNRYREEIDSDSKPSREVPPFRRRRINVAEPDQTRVSSSVKHRLGLSAPKSHHLKASSRRLNDDRKSSNRDRMSSDREKDVDARIRRISKQNAEILKRRQMIEMEEKRFRLKS